MATDNRRNDLIRALHSAYQNAESDLKNMRHSRDYWKNKYETKPETIGGGLLKEGDAHELLGCVALIRQTAAAIDREEYLDGQGEGLQVVATKINDLASRLMEMGY